MQDDESTDDPGPHEGSRGPTPQVSDGEKKSVQSLVKSLESSKLVIKPHEYGKKPARRSPDRKYRSPDKEVDRGSTPPGDRSVSSWGDTTLPMPDEDGAHGQNTANEQVEKEVCGYSGNIYTRIFRGGNE